MLFIYRSSSSQFLHNATIKKHAETFEKNDPHFARKILDSSYVDDGCLNEENTGQDITYTKIKHRSTSVNLIPQKWRTNCPELRIYIKQFEEVKGESGGEMLGVGWNEINDAFIIDPGEFLKREESQEIQITKRGVLSTIASVYDPVGFLTQVIIKFKICSQTICKSNIDWGELLTGGLLKTWTKMIEWVSDLEKINIGRCYCLLDVNDPFVNVQADRVFRRKFPSLFLCHFI